MSDGIVKQSLWSDQIEVEVVSLIGLKYIQIRFWSGFKEASIQLWVTLFLDFGIVLRNLDRQICLWRVEWVPDQKSMPFEAFSIYSIS